MVAPAAGLVCWVCQAGFVQVVGDPHWNDRVKSRRAGSRSARKGNVLQKATLQLWSTDSVLDDG